MRRVCLHCDVSVSNDYFSLCFLCLQVFWQKDGVDIDVEREITYIISSEGNLIISQAKLSDTANYTCGAENAAGRRFSESATLTVYGNAPQ